jgi:hypothetical protein
VVQAAELVGVPKSEADQLVSNLRN